jgi:hypothetical protein
VTAGDLTREARDESCCRRMTGGGSPRWCSGDANYQHETRAAGRRPDSAGAVRCCHALHARNLQRAGAGNRRIAPAASIRCRRTPELAERASAGPGPDRCRQFVRCCSPHDPQISAGARTNSSADPSDVPERPVPAPRCLRPVPTSGAARERWRTPPRCYAARCGGRVSTTPRPSVNEHGWTGRAPRSAVRGTDRGDRASVRPRDLSSGAGWWPGRRYACQDVLGPRSRRWTAQVGTRRRTRSALLMLRGSR